MKIVIEQSLAINIFLNLLILKMVSRIMRRKTRLSFLSGIIGAILALIEPIWNIQPLLKICLMICTSFIMILISFKYISLKEFMLSLSLFMLATFLFGGACQVVNQTFGNFPLFIVAIIALVIFALVNIITKFVNHHRRMSKFTYNLTFIDGDKVIREEGYLDSGNVLYDTITKKPVVLITYDVFRKFYDNISLVSLVTKEFNSSSIKNGHYIKINSVGKGTSILIFTVDQLKVEGDERMYKNVSLGVSFSGFEKSFGKNVLLHCDFS